MPKLERIKIIELVNMCFPKDNVPVSISIKINEPNFSAEFNQNKDLDVIIELDWLNISLWD